MRMRKIAEAKGASIALAWLLAKPHVSTIMIGAKNEARWRHDADRPLVDHHVPSAGSHGRRQLAARNGSETTSARAPSSARRASGLGVLMGVMSTYRTPTCSGHLDLPALRAMDGDCQLMSRARLVAACRKDSRALDACAGRRSNNSNCPSSETRDSVSVHERPVRIGRECEGKRRDPLDTLASGMPVDARAARIAFIPARARFIAVGSRFLG
jgi:hypothetical protein